MSQADLVADLKASLHDAASVFTAATDGDFKRLLDAAALDMGSFRPRTILGSVILVAGQSDYAAPAGFAMFKSSLWGIAPIAAPRPWERGYPGKLPDAFESELAGVRQISLTLPPTAEQIAQLGNQYLFYYFAAHVVDAVAANTTIKIADRGLLLLRAQAEAMRELAMRNIGKPVTVRDGTYGINGDVYWRGPEHADGHEREFLWRWRWLLRNSLGGWSHFVMGFPYSRLRSIEWEGDTNTANRPIGHSGTLRITVTLDNGSRRTCWYIVRQWGNTGRCFRFYCGYKLKDVLDYYLREGKLPTDKDDYAQDVFSPNPLMGFAHV